MTSLTSRLRPLALALALPVGGIAISYAIVLDAPLRHRVAEVQTKVAKLNATIRERSPQHIKNAQQLELAQRQLRELTKLVTTVPPPEKDQVAEPIEQPLTNADSDISRLSALLTLFSRHHVECLASQPVDLPSDSKKSTVDSDHRAQRITLQGCFADMHGALEEMQSALNCVSIVSLEMEASLEGESSHQWVLILLL